MGGMGGLPLRELCILFICIKAIRAISLDVNTTCSAPPAYVGEPGALTCYFHVDVKAQKLSFNVRRADHNDFDFNRDTVLDCDWIGGQQLCMTIKEGFIYDYKVNNLLTIIIPNVTLEHQGLYSCKLFDEAPRNIQVCKLTVTEREEPNVNSSDAVTSETQEPPTTPEQEKDTLVHTGVVNIIAIVVPTVIAAVLVVVVVVVYMFKRRNHEGSESVASEIGDEETNDRIRMLENSNAASETPAENRTAADETPAENLTAADEFLPTLQNYSEGQYATIFEIDNELPTQPLESGAKAIKKKRDDYAKVNKTKKQDDYAKVNKKKKKATTTVDPHDLETRDQERDPLTNGEGVVSSEARNPDDNEKEAADRYYPSIDGATSVNNYSNGRNGDEDADSRNSDTGNGREYTERDIDISDDKRLQRGDSREKREHNKMFKEVVKDISAHNATGNTFKHHVTDDEKKYV